MTFERFSKDDQTVILQSMRAILIGPYIDDSEFRTRLGIDRKELAEVVSNYPNLDHHLKGSIASLAANNCMNEIVYGLDIPPNEWNNWFSISKTEVRKTYERLKQRKALS